jgi:fucose 4-O-acetylase-like acetyltransferase
MAFFVIGVLGIQLFWNVKIPISVTNFFMTDGNLYLINGLINNPEYSKEALLMDKQFILKGLPWSADFVLITSAFFMSGYFVKQNRIENLFHKGSIVLIMLLVFIASHSLFNYTFNLNIRRYDNLFICTIVAFAAIYIFIYLSYCITKVDNKISRFIKYVGRYSLIVFIFHAPIQSKVYFSLLSLLTQSMYFVAILTAFAAGVCIPLLLNWLVLERFKIFRFWYYAK